MEKEKSIADSHYESIMTTLQKLLLQPPAPSSSATICSGTKSVSYSSPMLTSPLSGVISPTHTLPPTTVHIPLSTTTTHIPNFSYSPHNHIPPLFPPYPFIPSTLPPQPPYNIHFSHNLHIPNSIISLHYPLFVPLNWNSLYSMVQIR